MSEDEAIKILKEITLDDLLNCWEGGEKEFEAIETILDLYQQQKEKNKELLQEKELNQSAINIANHQLCNYELGYQDGLHNNITATKMVIEHRKNFIIQQEIKKLKDIIYDLHKTIDKGNERVKQEYISKDIIKEKIEELRKIHKERDFTNKESFYLDCYKELLEEE